MPPSTSRRVFYLTHPEVRIDPAVPVPRWSLSEVGAARARTAATAPFLNRVTHIVASEEAKAIETARIIGEARGLPVLVRAGLHENDRSATGYLPPDGFEAMRQAFFARPDAAVRGWEPARVAQARIVAGVTAALAALPEAGDVLFAGHGAVGTLLMCHVAHLAIAVTHDQPAGGGNVFCFDRTGGTLLHGWRRLEDPRLGEPA